MLYNDGTAGFLTIIFGPMFSEKSGELIKKCKYAKRYQHKEVLIYKPAIDDRFSEDEVVSRLGLTEKALNLSQDLAENNIISDIYAQCENMDIVAFDEAQFFSKEIVIVVDYLVAKKKHVIVSGLNLDFLGRTFGYIKDLSMFADEIILKNAYCNQCGRPAGYTQRLINSVAVTDIHSQTIVIGDEESYEARCRLCFVRE
ncbi:MAG: thymidine kinase [Oscillospiraceae bacterium]